MKKIIHLNKGFIFLGFNPELNELEIRIGDGFDSPTLILDKTSSLELSANILSMFQENLPDPSDFIGELHHQYPNITPEAWQEAIFSNYLQRTPVLHQEWVDICLYDQDIRQEDIQMILSACDGLMHALGYELEKEEEPAYGSFFQRIKYFLKDPKTVSEISQGYENAKLAINLNYINAPMAEATNKYAASAALLVESLANVNSAAIRLGALLLIKTTDGSGVAHVFVNTISPFLSQMLDAKPELLKSPEIILELLSKELSRNEKSNESEQVG